MKNIFISSTFIDMQAERDLVQERVLPALRDEARKYGDNVGVIDLRWGVDTSTLETEEGAAKVLKVCLDEIDRSHPYMLIFLGERYGTMMREDQIEKSVRGREDKYTTDDYVKSITALEVEYGALSEKYGELNHCVVCFREPVVHMLDGEEARLYAEHTEEGKRKLEALKERIKRDLGEEDRLITYSCVWDKSARQLVDFTSKGQSLETVLTNCFVEMFRDDWKEYENLSWQDKEQLAFRALMESKLRPFVGREALLEEYYQSAVSGTCPIILQGEIGSGKTAIMCKLVERLQKEGKKVFAFFAGAGSMSSTAESLVKQMVYYVENLLGIKARFEESSLEIDSPGILGKAIKYSDWIERLKELIYCLSEEKSVYFFIDGLDQLLKDEHVEKLDFLIKGKQVQFMASCTNEFVVPMNALEDREVKRVSDLNIVDAKAVVESILASYSRNAYAEIEKEIISKKGIGSPLYVSLLIQRLNMMDASELRKAMTEADIISLGKEIVREIPDELDSAIAYVIENAIEKVGGNTKVLKDVLNYLAVSRGGLRMQDLQGVFKEKEKSLPIIDFTLLMKYLDTFFYVLEDGWIDFTHKAIRRGLLKKIEDRRTYEEEIKNYLVHGEIENALSMKEGMYFARIFEEYPFAQKLISYGTKNKELMRAIKENAMEDEGAFLEKVLGYEGENQKKAITYFINKRSKVFESLEGERKVKLHIGQTALTICEKAYEESKSEEDAVILADCLLYVGRVMRDFPDYAFAEKYMKKSIEYYRWLHKRNNKWENTYSLVNACMTITLLPTFDESEKNKMYEYIATLLEPFQKIKSEDILACMSTLQINKGMSSVRKGDFESAYMSFEIALRYRKNLTEIRNTEQTQTLLYDAYEKLSFAFCEEGKIEKAKVCCDKCLEGREWLYSRNSSISNLRRLVHVYINMGRLYVLDETNTANKEQALYFYTKAVQCAEELHKIEASIMSLQELATICNDTAVAYMSQAGMEKYSLLFCEKARKYAEHLYKMSPDKVAEELLITIYQVASSVYGSIGNEEGQEEVSKKALYLVNEKLAQTEKADSKSKMALAYATKAQNELEKENNDDAIQYAKLAIDCIREESKQLNIKSLSAMVLAYNTLNIAYSNKREDEAAEMAMEKCLLYVSEIKVRFPELSEKLGFDEFLQEETERSSEQMEKESENSFRHPLVDEIAEYIKDATAILLLDYRGLTVEQDTKIRTDFKKINCVYKVYKNSFAKLAFSETGNEELIQHLEGTTAMVISHGDIKEMENLACEYQKDTPITIKAAIVDGAYYNAEEFLIKIRHEQEEERLKEQLVQGLRLPITRLENVLKRVLQQKKEEEQEREFDEWNNEFINNYGEEMYHEMVSCLTWRETANEVYITGIKEPKEYIWIPAKINGKSVCKIGDSIGTPLIKFDNTIRRLSIPNSVTHIYKYAFRGLYALRSLNISKSVCYIAEQAFSVKILEEIMVEEGNLIFTSRDSDGNECNAIINSITKTLLLGCGKTIIPEGVETISSYAITSSEDMEEIRIPKSVKRIENQAINVKDIEYIIVDAENESYTSREVTGRECNAIIDIVNKELVLGCAETVFPTGIISIGEWAFARRAELKELVVPNGVKVIKHASFWGCNNLMQVEFPEGLERIEDDAFYECESLTEVRLPESIKHIGAYAFGNCSNLTSVTIPKNVNYIDPDAFYGCEKLKEIIKA